MKTHLQNPYTLRVNYYLIASQHFIFLVNMFHPPRLASPIALMQFMKSPIDTYSNNIKTPERPMNTVFNHKKISLINLT